MGNGQRNCRNRKLFADVLFGVCLAVTVLCAVLIVHGRYLEWKEERFWKKVASMKEYDSAQTSVSEILPEYRELYNQNSDLVGWIQIDGTKIDYPVVQTKNDPEYYLRRNFEKEYSNEGMPFADYRCNVSEPRSFNVIIYGHYTQGDSMFRWLLNYDSEAWYQKNKTILFDTIGEKGIYEVVAAFYYDATDAVLLENPVDGEDAYAFYNYIELDSKDGFEKYRAQIESLKLYDTAEAIEKEDALLTLICCAPAEFSGVEENGRFVVIAKRL